MKWTRDVITRVRRDAATHTREQMAACLGISINALDGAVQRYGFQFRRAMREDHSRIVTAEAEGGLSVELRAEIDAARAEAAEAPLYRRPTLF